MLPLEQFLRVSATIKSVYLESGLISLFLPSLCRFIVLRVTGNDVTELLSQAVAINVLNQLLRDLNVLPLASPMLDFSMEFQEVLCFKVFLAEGAFILT